MFSEGAIFSSTELCRIGWSKRAIRKHLREEIIFSFAGIDLFLKGAVEEVALDLPNGKLKTEIALHKLLS